MFLCSPVLDSGLLSHALLVLLLCTHWLYTFVLVATNTNYLNDELYKRVIVKAVGQDVKEHDKDSKASCR